MTDLILPDTTRAKLERALKTFDRDHRGSDEWAEWLENQSHRYAVKWQGQLYPAKKIVSLATEVPVGLFSGGVQTNRYLEAYGFEIFHLPRTDQPSSYEIHFDKGHVYDRRGDIHDLFGGSHRGGISPSAKAPAIFVFTGDSGEQYGYTDRYDDFGVFHYTGEGQNGPMQLSGGNKAILNHAKDGRSIHLFKALGKKKGKSQGQLYMGEFACSGHSWIKGPDHKGNERDLIVFQLIPVDRIDDNELEQSEIGCMPHSLAPARKAAIEAMSSPDTSNVSTAPRNIYKRSAQVKNYVLIRANGHCESCGNEAPFIRKNGLPYLEPHHINRLSDGGLDHPMYVGAVCPSCHREIHYGISGAEKNEQLRRYVEQREKALST